MPDFQSLTADKICSYGNAQVKQGYVICIDLKEKPVMEVIQIPPESVLLFPFQTVRRNLKKYSNQLCLW